jgi:hypothetical protein
MNLQMIPAEVILANLCAANMVSISISDLSAVRCKLEANFGCIYVEITDSDIQYALRSYPQLFSQEAFSHIIDCKVKLNSLYVNKQFNWRLDEDRRNAIVKVIKDYVKEKN